MLAVELIAAVLVGSFFILLLLSGVTVAVVAWTLRGDPAIEAARDAEARTVDPMSVGVRPPRPPAEPRKVLVRLADRLNEPLAST